MTASTLFAQDTLTVVQYNLLNYGNFTSYCTNENNNIDEKDEYIRTIIEYLKPDIFSVNEISKNEEYHDRLLDEVLNVNGVNYYRMANFIKEANSYLVNILYYNSAKLQLHTHTIAQNYIRDIDVYKLYYRSDDLEYGDTAFIECVVAHLKAGNGTDEKETRNVMVSNAMNYLDNSANNGNRLFMGDFNVYTSSEPAYQLLTDYSNPDFKFYDPIDTPGSWNNNYSYRNVHTQSTHADQNGCASHGGMDDRFDFILISENIKESSNNVEYIDGSYKAIGQDGLHFNMSINDSPENLSAPSNVIEAIYGNSDHLPVSLKLKVDKTLDFINYEHELFTDITFNNPADKSLKLDILSKKDATITISIFSMSGVVLLNDDISLTTGNNKIAYDISTLSPGIYLAVFANGENNKTIKKIIKK